MPPLVEHPTYEYLFKQAENALSTHARIGKRPAIAVGRVIPDAEDLALHDGRAIDASVLYLDISGFTGRPQETHQQQEDLLRALSLFFTAMIRIVEDFGGVVEKNTGDGLMAYFVREAGDSEPVQQRAVNAAMTMFDVNSRSLRALIAERGIEPFSFRICIDHGPITIARIGIAKGFNGIVAVGTPANLACKMLAVAKAGEIMIGNNVADALSPLSRSFLRPSAHPTGYHYVESGISYPYWYYTGVWV